MAFTYDRAGALRRVHQSAVTLTQKIYESYLLGDRR